MEGLAQALIEKFELNLLCPWRINRSSEKLDSQSLGDSTVAESVSDGWGTNDTKALHFWGMSSDHRS